MNIRYLIKKKNMSNKLCYLIRFDGTKQQQQSHFDISKRRHGIKPTLRFIHT